MQQVLRHEAAGGGGARPGEDAVGAREQRGQHGEAVEQAVEGRLGVPLPGRRRPLGRGEEGRGAVEERGEDLDVLGWELTNRCLYIDSPLRSFVATPVWLLGSRRGRLGVSKWVGGVWERTALGR